MSQLVSTHRCCIKADSQLVAWTDFATLLNCVVWSQFGLV